ncbi:GcrA family cell cycle regulator [Rhizobium leguminosarum]
MNIHVEVDKDAAAEMWNEGLSITDIAARYGVTRSKISGMMNRDRDRFPKRRGDAPPRYARTGGRKPQPRPPGEARAKPLHNNVGYKMRDMRNSRKARMEATRRDAEEFAAGTSPLLQIAPDDAEKLNTGMGKELMDLGAHECKWALTNGGPWIFCAESTDGAVYCDHHASRAYVSREAR